MSRTDVIRLCPWGLPVDRLWRRYVRRKGRRNRALDRAHEGPDLHAVAGEDERPGCSDAGDHRAENTLGDPRLQRGRRHRAATDGCGAAGQQSRTSEQTLLQRGCGQHRQQDRELLALGLDLGAELAAAIALTQVAPEVRATQHGPATVRELLANLRAGRVTGRAVRDQRLTRLVHQGLDLVAWNPEHAGDVLVGQSLQLGQHQCGALFFGEPAYIGDQIAEILATLDLDGEPFGRGLIDRVGRLLTTRADDRVAAVAGHRVQPRPQVDRRVRVRQFAVRGHERVLNRILGLVGVAEHVPTEGQDPLVMPIV
jgi:hypothetical protein